jgi:hydrogenase maturation protein HypF
VARLRFVVAGVVQGVGFRPFVYSLAGRFELAGSVCNTSGGVTIEAEGLPDALEAFAIALEREAPPLAKIDWISHEAIEPTGEPGFTILESRPEPGAFQPISPDLCTCSDCLREMADPSDRRYRYPFINCTNCGPRFTIISEIPYDRPNTTMAAFEMCPDCRYEYDDPRDRRFHAQPVACPTCGPRVWLEGAGLDASRDEAIAVARRLLREGQIIAVKGLGGFHLACDATNDKAVRLLRERKGRVDKPFALMMADIAQVERHCRVSSAERAVLESRERPIVLLVARGGAEPAISRWVAPHQGTLGVMLPYTPLHALLLEPEGSSPFPPLVMTSGNFAEEPIATNNWEASRRFAWMADALLLHDRDIHIRTDDSVVRIFRGAELPIRRSRGYAPYPVHLPFDVPPILAVGAELKNTFCVARGPYAFLSHHIGDLENYETLRSFEDGIAHFEGIFRARPEALACDLHPDYLSTHYARDRAGREGIPAFGVQHHHAHIAACMAEHTLGQGDRVIGVAFDGTGLGADDAIWGGEFLVAGYAGYERPYHLDYVPLPGGEAAIRKPARIAMAHLLAAGIAPVDLPPARALTPAERAVVEHQARTGLNSPRTSSMGRLFDAVASIAGVRHEVNYEGQAAIELEAIVDPEEGGAYGFEIGESVVLAAPVIRRAAEDVLAGVSASRIAARFHNAIGDMIIEVCDRIREACGLELVALSGGVFQNVTLLGRAVTRLEGAGFRVLTHRRVPPNDGGVSLGQAVVAAHAFLAGRAPSDGGARENIDVSCHSR